MSGAFGSPSPTKNWKETSFLSGEATAPLLPQTGETQVVSRDGSGGIDISQRIDILSGI